MCSRHASQPEKKKKKKKDLFFIRLKLNENLSATSVRKKLQICEQLVVILIVDDKLFYCPRPRRRLPNGLFFKVKGQWLSIRPTFRFLSRRGSIAYPPFSFKSKHKRTCRLHFHRPTLVGSRHRVAVDAEAVGC